MKILEKYSISFYGPALLLRTKKGRNFLKKLASIKRFWHGFGTFGIIFCFLMMFLVVSLLVFNAWTVLGFTAQQKQALPGIEFALVIPGLNPILPLEYILYIILALVIAVIVHEFSHGILTIAANLKVKSLGILYLIIPLGAFCEPDEEQLRKTKTKNRMKVYAAGPTSNFAIVLISLLLISFVLMPAVNNAADGVGIIAVAEDAPADDIGIQTGMILNNINDTKIETIYDFVIVMNATKANQTVNITYASGKQLFSKTVVLSDKYD
jgi:membrane-associated protease RseP (regulator of RpoE activity)